MAASAIAGVAGPSYKLYWLQVSTMSGYWVISSLSVLLLCYLRLHRHVAFRGDERASRKIILPAYEPLLILIAVETAMIATYLTILISTTMYPTLFPPIINEVNYCVRQIVFVTVIVFMLQKSVSMPATRRTALISFGLGSYTIPIVLILSSIMPADSSSLFWISMVCRRLLLVFYVYVFWKPPMRASLKSIRAYCVYTIVYQAISLIYSILRYYKVNPNTLVVSSLIVITWGSICPLWIWKVLRADTEYWRGMGDRACSLQAVFRQKRAMDEQISSHGLHVLIEMHRKYIIDFAHLEVKSRIGVGASAVVFAGVLKNQRPVAIKMYTPRSFTEDTVAQFSHEAAFSATLHHPNIVEFIGMCVSPPTISLVAELCHTNLEDMLNFAHAKQNSQHCGRQRSQRWTRGQYDAKTLLKITYMLDAARAVAYLHSFSPPLLHRDIKPANFLVDADNNVKLTDFGESRRLPRQHLPPQYQQQHQQRERSHSEDKESLNSMHSIPAFLQETPAPRAMMTVTGTVHYMAPEMIRGRSGLAAYGQAADVYSLAITLWDILYPQRTKFPDMHDESNHFLVLDRVLDGSRPRFDNDVHPKVRNLIMCAWHSDPNCRPTAQQIVDTLESVEEEVFAMLALDLSDDLERQDVVHGQAMKANGRHHVLDVNTSDLQSEKSNSRLGRTHQVSIPPSHPSFTGEYAIEHMEEMLGIDPLTGEGIRLGNALMDAGFLHHSTHSQGFECSSSSTYFFDQDSIHLCQPVAMLEERSGYLTGDSSSETQSPSVKDESDFESLSAIRERAARNPTPSLQRKQHRGHSRFMSRIASTFSGHSTSSGSDRNLDGTEISTGSCACRRYAQRLETACGSPNAQRARQERLNRAGHGPDRWHTITEGDEELLTLADSSTCLSSPFEGEGFNHIRIVTPVNYAATTFDTYSYQ